LANIYSILLDNKEFDVDLTKFGSTRYTGKFYFGSKS